MSWILWILPLVGGLSLCIGEFKTDLEYSRQHSFNSEITKSKVAQIRAAVMSVTILPFPKFDAKFGQELVLSCMVEDLPPPSFTWLQTRRGVERLRSNSSTLILTSISYADAGEWRCLASNSVGNWTSRSTELSVFGPPASLSTPGTVVGRVGQKLVITAGFCCHPPPSVDWVVGAKTLIKEESSRIAFSTKPEPDSCYSTILTFNQLSTSDSGEVVVEVANSEGGQRRVIMVEVAKDEELKVDKDPIIEDEVIAEIKVVGVVAGEMKMRMEEEEEEEEKVRRKELKVKLVKEEAETPMEVIASLWVGGIATLTLLSLVVLQVSGLLFKCSKSQICRNKFYILGVKDIPLVQRKKEHWSKHSSLAGPSVVSQLFTSRL